MITETAMLRIFIFFSSSHLEIALLAVDQVLRLYAEDGTAGHPTIQSPSASRLTRLSSLCIPHQRHYFKAATCPPAHCGRVSVVSLTGGVAIRKLVDRMSAECE